MSCGVERDTVSGFSKEVREREKTMCLFSDYTFFPEEFTSIGQ